MHNKRERYKKTLYEVRQIRRNYQEKLTGEPKSIEKKFFYCIILLKKLLHLCFIFYKNQKKVTIV